MREMSCSVQPMSSCIESFHEVGHLFAQTISRLHFCEQQIWADASTRVTAHLCRSSGALQICHLEHADLNLCLQL